MSCLEAFVLGHEYTETVTDELLKSLEELSLPLKFLLTLDVSKGIKANINKTLCQSLTGNWYGCIILSTAYCKQFFQERS